VSYCAPNLVAVVPGAELFVLELDQFPTSSLNGGKGVMEPTLGPFMASMMTTSARAGAAVIARSVKHRALALSIQEWRGKRPGVGGKGGPCFTNVPDAKTVQPVGNVYGVRRR